MVRYRTGGLFNHIGSDVLGDHPFLQFPNHVNDGGRGVVCLSGNNQAFATVNTDDISTLDFQLPENSGTNSETVVESTGPTTNATGTDTQAAVYLDTEVTEAVDISVHLLVLALGTRASILRKAQLRTPPAASGMTSHQSPKWSQWRFG